MIDVHCHYLPAVDDGAQDLQSALRLIRLARADGVRKLVLTPHVHAGRWDNSLGFLLPRFDAFRNLVASKNIDVELYLGPRSICCPNRCGCSTRGRSRSSVAGMA